MGAWRGLLANSRLVRLLAGEFVSSVGDWIYLVAVLVLAYDVVGDPLLLGVVGAARILPYVALSVPAGYIVDRFDRRTVLLVADLGRGLIMVALAVLASVGAEPLLLIGLIVAATCLSVFFSPAIVAYLPLVVRDESELGPANSAWATLDNLAFFVGPAVGGLLVAAGGLSVAFALNAASFAIVAGVLATLPSGRPETKADRHARVEPTGASLAATAGAARGPLLIDLGTSFAGGALGVMTVVLAVDVLAAGEAGTGYLNSAIGVGGVAAGVLSGVLLMRPLAIPLVIAGAVSALSLASLGLATTLPFSLAAIGVASGAMLFLDIVGVTWVQRRIEPALLGRTTGLLQTTGALAFAAGGLAGPLLAASVGIAPTMALSGGLVAVVALFAALDGRGLEAPAAAADEERRLLLDLSVFAGLPPARLEATARASAVRPVRTGDVIVQQGEPADRFYVVAEGRFEVTQDPGDGAWRTLRTLGPGEFFGEIGLLTRGPRTATVTARTDGRLLVLDGEQFLELVGSGPGLTSLLLDWHRTAGTVS